MVFPKKGSLKIPKLCMFITIFCSAGEQTYSLKYAKSTCSTTTTELHPQLNHIFFRHLQFFKIQKVNF